MVTITYEAGEVDFLNLTLVPAESATIIGGHEVPGFDAWNVMKAGGLLTFTAIVQGDTPREYVMRPGGEPWINGARLVPIRLLYGDGLGLAPASHTPERVTQIATLDDGAGQDGLDGIAASADVTDLARAGSGLAALAADRALAAETGLARWMVVRSEAVSGASLTQLAAGQPWVNMIRARDQAIARLADYGRTGQLDVVTILHGAGDNSATYKTDLLALCGAIRSAGARQINLVVPGGTSERGDYASALATVEAFRERGTLPIRLVTPLYSLPRTGLAGLTPQAVTMLAELDALCAADPTWLPPLAFQAARSRSTISVDFEVMPGRSLVVPTQGLTHSGAAISNVAVVADPLTGHMTRLQITLASAAAGTLRYAINPAGPAAGDLRDDWGAPSITGATLRRWALPFKFEV